MALCSMVGFNDTKPYQTLLLTRLHVTKSTSMKCILLQHIALTLSFIHLPVSQHLFLHLLPLSHLPFSDSCPHPITASLTFSHSRAPLPHSAVSFFLFFFLSIHTTESLLIICDLLKYIHCHSLWLLPLTQFTFPLSAQFPAHQPPRITHRLPYLSPCLPAFLVSFVFLFWRIIFALPPPAHLLFISRSSQQ